MELRNRTYSSTARYMSQTHERLIAGADPYRRTWIDIARYRLLLPTGQHIDNVFEPDSVTKDDLLFNLVLSHRPCSKITRLLLYLVTGRAVTGSKSLGTAVSITFKPHNSYG